MDTDRPNRLAGQASPYLRRHGGHPVDWYPWGDEAFELARRLDRPVFVSVGYAACHWCHVMEALCFRDAEVAALMNTAFVNVKVDREERPDVDELLMTACTLLTGSGGWPLSVVMTPDRSPFWAGTFLPKRGRSGRPGMMELVPRIAALWRDDRRRLLGAAHEITAHLAAIHTVPSPELPDPGAADAAFSRLRSSFDPDHGGFGGAPKFPALHQVLFLLGYPGGASGDEAVAMATRTLDGILDGGIHDQLGHGIHRYATDVRWLVPHWEKMLPDQAMLLLALAEAFAVVGQERYRTAALDTAGFLERCLAGPEELFRAAVDADGEGGEGRYYLWTAKEIRSALPPEEARVAFAVWGIEEDGNHGRPPAGERDGTNVLHVAGTPDSVAGELGIPRSRVIELLENARELLLEIRERRPRPPVDGSLLTDWNALAAAGLTRVGRLLGEPRLVERARAVEAAIWTRMETPSGELLHRPARDGAPVPALLDDHVFLAWAELELYAVTFDPRHIERAIGLADTIENRFSSGTDGAFFRTPGDTVGLGIRTVPLADTDLPSPNAVMVLVLVRLARLTGEDRYERRAEALLRAAAGAVARHPTRHLFLLHAENLARRPGTEVVVVGPRHDPATGALLLAARDAGRDAAILLVEPSVDDPIRRLAPFTAAMGMACGLPTAHVCRDRTCFPPVTDPGALHDLLGRA